MKNSQNGHILNPELTSISAAKAHSPKRRDIQGLRYLLKLKYALTLNFIVLLQECEFDLSEPGLLFWCCYSTIFQSTFRMDMSAWICELKFVLVPKIFSLISNLSRFFVISGYLIGMIVCKFEVLDRQALQIFYYRRAKV